MSHEASKAAVRRLRDPVWRTHYLVGDAIDIKYDYRGFK